MKENSEKYSLAVLVPTRNRSDKLKQCLASLANQTVLGFSVVIVASGDDVSSVVSEFDDVLEIKYVQSSKWGQVNQRNIGIKLLLDSRIEYVCFLDDDMVLDPGSLSAIRKFIDKKRNNGETVFGVGLNIVNSIYYSERPFLGVRKLLLRVGNVPGAVTRTGMNTSIENVQTDIYSDWLGGGYTVWNTAILRQYPQAPSKTKHAAGEDLIYSYMVGKKYNLYVCHNARVVHQDEFNTDVGNLRYRIRKDTVAHCVFCDQHTELNVLLYIITGFIYYSLLLFVPRRKGFALFFGFLSGLYYYFSQRKAGAELLDD